MAQATLSKRTQCFQKLALTPNRAGVAANTAAFSYPVRALRLMQSHELIFANLTQSDVHLFDGTNELFYSKPSGSRMGRLTEP